MSRTGNFFLRIRALSRKAVEWGLYLGSDPTIDNIIDQADKNFFRAILRNSNHVLQQLMPPLKSPKYNLRRRPHDYTLTKVKSKDKRNFICRMLFLDAY